MIKTAMILAAGRGERLKPLTNILPKALCPVQGKPLIEYHIERLAKSGFKRIIINHAYLGGQIRHYLGHGERWGVDILYSPEPPGGLETGGGIFNALPLLGDQPFLTVNADIYTDFDFSQVSLENINYLHLVLTKANQTLDHYGDFGLLDNGLLSNCSREYTFAGIACYHPAIFGQCKPGRYSVSPLIRSYADEGKASAEIHQGLWFDIGSAIRLEAANRQQPLR
jgi:MurNAc alpha-1-phosphate uridylyltransferase